MKKQKIKKSDLKEIHDIACSGWKKTIEDYANRNPFGNEIELSESEINSMFEASDEKQINILSKFFTRKESIIEKINSFEDACKHLGVKFKTYKDDTKNDIGFKKLKIVIKALNEGWYPNFNDTNENKYWNYFNMNKDVFSCYTTDYSSTSMYVPSALYLKSRDLAVHCVKICLDEYKDFYL